MKLLLTVLSSVFLLILLSFCNNSSGAKERITPSAEDTIYWDKATELVWGDFQARPNDRSSKVATTFSGLSFDFHSDADKFSLKVKVYFVKSESWTKTDDTFVLKHEKGHFDITEIGARKFWMKIKGKHLDDVKNAEAKEAFKKIKELYKETNQECDKMQDDYDNESKHSTDKPMQIKWNKKIKDLLEKLPEYPH